MTELNKTDAAAGTAPAARRGDRRQSEFLARLAHELRNPLAPIRMALQIMQVSEDDVATTRAARVIIDRQLRQMQRLIDDLNDVAQVTRGSIPLRCEEVALSSVIQAALAIARPQLESRQHLLHVDLGREPLWLFADPVRLSQAFANLLNNASKYSPASAPISIQAAVDDDAIIVTITDVGIGIPPDMLERVFEPFVQVDRSGTGTHEGLGIGLTLVRRVVELHNGTVWTESDGEGSGTRLVVRLPPRVPSQIEQAPVENGEAAANARKLRILVADDNRDTAQTLAIMLRFEGHEVRTAYDGLEALATGKLFQPELVFLDIGMPVLDGYQTARRIREQPWGKDVHLVALTGWSQETDRRQAAASGFEDHIVKPADADQLKAVIDRARATKAT
ncbi:MAG TPA: ATP-binding protein [Steroidobacteraceae bacterium]|nr:ATP-binding protein [Steroidobacteraceae bacterium]